MRRSIKLVLAAAGVVTLAACSTTPETTWQILVIR